MNPTNASPVVVYAGRDLLFATRIASTARAAGLGSASVRDAASLSAALAASPPPTCLVVDLDQGDAALTLIAHARAAAPDLRIVAFGPHVDRDLLVAAAEHGADTVLPRSRFVADMPRWLRGDGCDP